MQIEKLRVGHDGRGPAADWYVEEVILNSAVRGEHLIFPCHAWVAEEHGAGSADKELYPKQPGKNVTDVQSQIISWRVHQMCRLPAVSYFSLQNYSTRNPCCNVVVSNRAGGDENLMDFKREGGLQTVYVT